jgi:hypothetical protein
MSRCDLYKFCRYVWGMRYVISGGTIVRKDLVSGFLKTLLLLQPLTAVSCVLLDTGGGCEGVSKMGLLFTSPGGRYSTEEGQQC